MNKRHKILITGGSGKAGRWVVKDLLEHGYEVINVDWKPSDQVHTFQADLSDLGQTFGMVEGKDAIIHLAAIPWAGEHAPEYVFRNNVMSTFNILQAACVLGVNKVVIAGSEAALGFPFCFTPFSPDYLPIDEAHPLLAQDAYGLGKMVVEELARGYTRRDPRMSIHTLKLSYILRPEDYFSELRLSWADPGRNNFNLWAYIDSRDVASACRLSLEADQPGYDAFYIAAPDTLMREPTLDLISRYFPGVKRISSGFGGQASPLDCTHAEKGLGWTAQYTWKNVLSPEEYQELVRVSPPAAS